MTILIFCEKKTEKDAINIISKPDRLERRIVGAWHQSNIKHCFGNEKDLKKAVRKNRETLDHPDKIKTLFSTNNYLFSTKATGREETLYFEDQDTKRTGRLRQQHARGPLAKIDKRSRTHRFLSKKRLECVREWHDKHKGRLPHFYPSEKVAKNGKHHVDFYCDMKRVSAWHPSRGTTKTTKHDLDRRISSALENVLGTRSEKSSVIAKN